MRDFKLAKIAENKILFTVEPFKWLKEFESEKGITLVTPMTTVAELLKLKPNSELYETFVNIGEGVIKFLNTVEIEKVVAEINNKFRLSLVEFEQTGEKVVKSVLQMNEDLKVTQEFLEVFFSFMDASTAKRQVFIVAGFDDLSFGEFKMLTIHSLRTRLSGKVHWGNLQQLVMLDYEDLGEIVDKERFKSWLELKARTVLTIEDINSYFRGDATMNSFLINQALSALKQ